MGRTQQKLSRVDISKTISGRFLIFRSVASAPISSPLIDLDLQQRAIDMVAECLATSSRGRPPSCWRPRFQLCIEGGEKPTAGPAESSIEAAPLEKAQPSQPAQYPRELPFAPPTSRARQCPLRRTWISPEGGFVGAHDREARMPLPDHISARPEDLPSLIGGMSPSTGVPRRRSIPWLPPQSSHSVSSTSTHSRTATAVFTAT